MQFGLAKMPLTFKVSSNKSKYLSMTSLSEEIALAVDRGTALLRTTLGC